MGKASEQRGIRIGDQFADVFGERRGISTEQEALLVIPEMPEEEPRTPAPSPESLFVEDPDEAYRRQVLVRWWLRHNDEPQSKYEMASKAKIYGLAIRPSSKRKRVERCLGDVEALVTQGVCGSYRGYEGTRGYRIKDKGVWPAYFSSKFDSWESRLHPSGIGE